MPCFDRLRRCSRRVLLHGLMLLSLLPVRVANDPRRQIMNFEFIHEAGDLNPAADTVQ
jgi:hypothetical protein